MPITDTQLLNHVGGTAADKDELGTCLRLAVLWVDKHLADNYVEVGAGADNVPAEVYDEAVLLVAADEFSRRHAPNGVLNQQYQTEDGVQAVPVRISRDPLSAAYAPLGPWMPVVVGGL